MYGTGPLGKNPAGEFNFEPPPPGWAVYLEPTPRRVRVEVGRETIADSRRAFLLHESGLQPIYYFPPRDVRSDLLEPSDRVTHCPKKGDASYFTIRVGDRVVENGAWYYPEPIDSAPPQLQGLIAFYFDRVDRWLEEAEEISVHPRDPYHRIDVIPSDSQVRISLDGEVLAETTRALALFESNLPVRWYLPREDVLVNLEPSEKVTHCPYKGQAGYYSAAVDGGEDLAWYYAEPKPEVGAIAGRICFWNERVDIEVDGSSQEQPALARSR
ncbi:MAG TPA: DUF427 domain-containing protein [Solirubrobacteraceae bacterium]|nr:DUF427 domain-containing protein [Solirubrobacteraceae bacterium]